MDLELRGHVALVTGGGRGIGAAIGRALAREGCDVALVDRELGADSNALLEAIAAGGGRAKAWSADVTDYARAEVVVREVRAHFGRLDVLVCCAGITKDGVTWKMSEADWDAVVAVNLKGTFNYCHAAAAGFKEQQHGKIVLIASINGLRGKFGQANYAAAKAGGIALAKTLAKELGRYQVNVNVVAPGLVDTEMTKQLPKEAYDKAVLETVLGRAASVDDVADSVLFLVSARGKHITGEVLKVDGGQYI
ncbi:MAG: SDR family oxidoreductase [Deltaproteobacteria bacterium]|nr:SDR family oxidoreductase [Deltaproteobacteria bacterium]